MTSEKILDLITKATDAWLKKHFDRTDQIEDYVDERLGRLVRKAVDTKLGLVEDAWGRVEVGYNSFLTADIRSAALVEAKRLVEAFLAEKAPPGKKAMKAMQTKWDDLLETAIRAELDRRADAAARELLDKHMGVPAEVDE